MADVEIIYLKRERNKDYLNPNVSIHPPQNCKIIKQPENKVVKNKPKTEAPFFNPKKTVYLIAFFIILGVVVSSSFNAGYVPIKSFLEIKEPIGVAAEINIQETAEKYSLPIEALPAFESIKYKIYGSNQGKEVIEADYIDELRTEGFKLEYRGTKNIKGFDLNYYGFIKGLTTVAIITTSDDTYIKDYETLVLYSTGNVFEFAKIIKDNSGFLKT